MNQILRPLSPAPNRRKRPHPPPINLRRRLDPRPRGAGPHIHLAHRRQRHDHASRLHLAGRAGRSCGRRGQDRGCADRGVFHVCECGSLRD